MQCKVAWLAASGGSAAPAAARKCRGLLLERVGSHASSRLFRGLAQAGGEGAVQELGGHRILSADGEDVRRRPQHSGLRWRVGDTVQVPLDGPLVADFIMRGGRGMSRRSCEPRAASCEPGGEEAQKKPQASSYKLQASKELRARRGEAASGSPATPSRHRRPTLFLRITHHASSSRSRSPSARVIRNRPAGRAALAWVFGVRWSGSGGRGSGSGVRSSVRLAPARAPDGHGSAVPLQSLHHGGSPARRERSP